MCGSGGKGSARSGSCYDGTNSKRGRLGKNLLRVVDGNKLNGVLLTGKEC